MSAGSWIRTYLIADPSVPGDEEKLALTIFRDTSEELPELLRGTPILYRGMKASLNLDVPIVMNIASGLTF